MGAGADDGFLFVQNAFADIYGHFYVATAGQGPGTSGTIERNLDIEDNAVFRVFNGAYLYLADDWFIRNNSIVVVRGSVCAEIDDDMQIEDDAILCGAGGGQY